MTKTIRGYLEALYGEEADATYKQLVKRIGTEAAQPRGALFSERDVFLITYGDSLRREGQAPLQTLYEFAEKHLSEIVSHIHILPFYPYSSDAGFSVIDFYTVDPNLGTWGDIEALGQDFILMFDAVFNHMSAQSDWFKAFLDRQKQFENAFVMESSETDLSMVMRPRTSPLLTAFKRPDGETVHVWTTFSADQVDINFADPTTLLRIIDVLLFYVQKGAQVIRLDAIAYLWKIPGTSSIHLKQTHTVIQLMRAVLDVVAPSTILITETNVPHVENVSYFGNGQNEAQMVYNFTLPPLLFHTMLSGDATKLSGWVNTLDTPSDEVTFFNFTASHDGVGIRPVEGILDELELAQMVVHVETTGGRVSYKTNSDGTKSPYELNVTYVDAIVNPDEELNMQVKRFLVSQAIALSLAGAPAIYIHSLLGSRNNIEGMQQTGHNRTINRAKLNADEIEREIEDSRTFRSHVFHGLQKLIQVRRQQPEFHPNMEQEAVDVQNPAVFAVLRGKRLLALHNVTAQAQPIDYDGTGMDCLTGKHIHTKNLTLEPYQVLWIRLKY